MTLQVYDPFTFDRQRAIVIGPFDLVHEDAALEEWIRGKWAAQDALMLAEYGRTNTTEGAT
jgi:hypothetical protein